MFENMKYIVTIRFGAVVLTKHEDGFWYDDEGTIYAYKDGVTADSVDRCGVAPIALPTWPFFQDVNDACAPHDFAYSSPVYQAFHTRKQADDMLAALLTAERHPILGSIFEDIARLLGAKYWENPSTNN